MKLFKALPAAASILLAATLPFAVVETAYGQAINEQIQFGRVNAGLAELDKATGEKWSQLEDYQKRESWLTEQVRLGVVGTVYESGMFGGTVSRNVVPDKTSGWLVVDKIQIGAGPLLQVGQLAGNIFFQEYFPYVQVGAEFSRTYVNVRHRDTYRQALLASPFRFKKIPATTRAFTSFEQGELVSTVTAGGIYVRAGASIFDLLGVAFDGGYGIGPRAKVHVNKQFKMTLAKSAPGEILVMVENTNEIGFGVGLATGFTFENLIDVPIAIGINQASGYSPLRVNYKVATQKLRSIVYKINIRTNEGARAYARLMNRDLTAIDDLADTKSGSVVKELVRDGIVNTQEFNAGLDLILYRSGFRNIFTQARYNSRLQGGKNYRYEEFSAERMDEGYWWSGGEKSSEKYTAYVPVAGNGATGTFVLDSRFEQSDSETWGDELQGMFGQLNKIMNNIPVRQNIDAKRNYGEVSMGLTVRFPAPAIKRILTASERDLWFALGVSSGLANPTEWTTFRGRLAYAEEGANVQRDQYTQDVVGGANYDRVYEATRIRDFMRTLRRERNMRAKAQRLVDFLKADSDSKLLHRSMIELVGRDQLLIRGQVRGGSANPATLQPKKRVK